MPVTLAGLLTQGCLPIGVSMARKSVLLAPLADVAGGKPCLLEPRFDDTLAAYRGGKYYAVPTAEFARQAARWEITDPVRVIAHTSRCGSTLLANLLALRSQSLVVKEPGFLNQAVRQVIRARDAEARSAAAELVRGLVGYLGAVAQVHSRELVIKPTSWTSPLLATVLPQQRRDRWLLMWRNPVEVVASLMAAEPGWSRNAEARTDVLTVIDSPETGSKLGPLEFYALVWQAVVASFTLHPALDYAALRRDPAAAFRAVQGWLALDQDSELPAGFEQTLKRYSKGVDTVPFDPAGAHRRPPLSPADQAIVQAIVGDLAWIRGRAVLV